MSAPLTSFPTDRLGRVADVIDPQPDHRAPALSEGAGFAYIGIRDIRQDGSLDFESARMVNEGAVAKQERAFKIQTGDIVFCRVATLGFPRLIRPEGRFALSATLALIKPHSIEGRFLFYALDSLVTSHQIDLVSTGSTRQAIGIQELRRFSVPSPSSSRQRAVADYLDRETARIDALIAAKRRMVDLLEIRTWSHFAQLVERTQAPVTLLRRALTFITDGPFGSAFSSDDYALEGAPVVRLGNIGFAEYRHEEQAYIPLELANSFLRYRVRAGDLLIAGLGDARNHAGRACVAPDLGLAIVKGKCFCAHIDLIRAIPDYLALLLSSPVGAEAIGLAAHGSTRVMINLEIVKATPIPLPTLADQERIVRDVRAAHASIFRITKVLSDQIKLLTEHRRTLITEAVTGSLDIPDIAA